MRRVMKTKKFSRMPWIIFEGCRSGEKVLRPSLLLRQFDVKILLCIYMLAVF